MKIQTEEREVISTEDYVQEPKKAASFASKDISLVEKESESASELSVKFSLPTLADDPTYIDALSYMKALKKVRSTWESTLSKASNDALYEILAECLKLLMNADVYDIESSIRRCIEDECKKGMKKVQKNTTIEAKIVRVVFDNLYNRRRVHTYSVVLQEAKRQKVSATELADWITLYGGIEEIRLNAKPAHQRVKISQSKKKLTQEQRDQQKEEKEEQLRISLQSFDRLVESGVFCVGNIEQEDSLDADDINTDASSSVQETASKQSTDELVTRNSDAQSEPSHQKLESIDEPCEETSEQSEPESSQDEMLVCIAYRLANGKYDVKWELQDEDVRDLAIAAYRMEKHGVYSEYDQVKSMIQSRETAASIH